ncbi:unnamed protein product [Symbiodinium sp. KB8]|nr:unnamed protein product [Symbiodinium sp. KB8]
MPGDIHKTEQETAEYVVPTSTTDLEEVFSPAGGSSGNGEVEPLSPESEGGTYPPGLPHPLGSVEHDSSNKFKHGAGMAKPKSGPHADAASKSPRYVNLDFVATPFVETLDVALPQKLPLPLFPGPAKPESSNPFDRTLHDRGECKPCAWFWTPGGCQKGEACEFCHLCPAGELKARRKQRLQELRALKRGEVPLEPKVIDCEASPSSMGESSAESAPADPGPVRALPSIGSAAHGVDCRPCAWFWKSEGCKNGKACRHCHLCPEGEIRRKKKMKQEDIKQAVASQRAQEQLQDHLVQMQMFQQMQASMMVANMVQMSQAAFQPFS